MTDYISHVAELLEQKNCYILYSRQWDFLLYP